MTVHTGVLIVLCAAVAIAAGTVWVTRASRRRAANALAEEAPHEAPVERRGRGRFLLPALLFVLFNAVTVVFFAWGPVFRALGWSGIGTIAAFTLPILVGLAYQWRMRALEW